MGTLTLVNPGARKNYSIRHASKNGHVEVVELLLEDSRVNPGARENYAIRLASENGQSMYYLANLPTSLVKVKFEY
ncbi:hypothetical protein O9G_004840 [Rozella allomycis CSF55]|uniref:Ankyrin n=1 Tax=Rozella allomycis (strain CSF55) TaxID=988480 RepID=A0A075AWQ4_ROZAC|nr:hypothetical protein O9G_004840 [Rozella allomycis CSF55]|eukprot:EPZ34672.1 hypothetical protein O9G_004840 [Rozella allomycis CSF55]